MGTGSSFNVIGVESSGVVGVVKQSGVVERSSVVEWSSVVKWSSVVEWSGVVEQFGVVEQSSVADAGLVGTGVGPLDGSVVSVIDLLVAGLGVGVGELSKHPSWQLFSSSVIPRDETQSSGWSLDGTYCTPSAASR